jgi:drug/metabolite transporter (DMT)-like permease
MAQHRPLLGALYMILTAFCFAIINSLVQYINISWHIKSPMVALIQYGLALLFTIPWILKIGINEGLKTNKLSLQLLRVFFAVIGLQLWLWALAKHIPIWQGISLLMLSPIFSTIGSKIILHEEVGPYRWLATITGFIGASLILEPWAENFNMATYLPIGAAFFWSCCSMCVKKLSKTESTSSIIVYLLLFTTPFNLFIVAGNIIFPIGVEVWGLLALAGLLTAIAQYLLIRAYTVAEASYIQPFDHIKLPLNVLTSFIVFGTVPPGKLWLGAILIISAAIFITHYERKKVKEFIFNKKILVT